MSVTILCPNGRRQTMKVNPNTSILEILEYVCEKQGFDANEYELSRFNKTLDLSLTVRFANIPNNGQIDLKKSAVIRRDQKVTIAMDLEDGMRQIKEFESNQNLWNIIHCMFENNPILNLEQNMEFSVIYIQKEISGEKALKETNLKSLGLVQGRAAMKLLIRPINAIKEQAFVESLDLTKIGKQSESESNRQTTTNQTESKKGSANVTQSKPKVKSTQQTSDNPIEIQEANEEVMEYEETQNQKSYEEAIQQSEAVQQMEESSEESEDESEEILNYLGGNNFEILFKMSDLPKVSRKDLPDAFYQTTKDDLMHVLKDLRRQQVANNEKPLETKQMREQRIREQKTKYKSTVVRVCFPNDKLVFQAIFKPSDTIDDVKKVISRYISSEDFYLYTTPPKRILKSDSSLFDSDLVPAALIHFGLNSDNSQQNVIRKEFKSKISSYKSAAKIAAEARNWKQSVDNTSAHTSGQQSTDNRSGRGSSPGQKEKRVPKWFKSSH